MIMIRLVNVSLVQNRTVTPCEILIRDGCIAEMTSPGGLEKVTDAAVLDGGGRYVSHGFIDIHTHGGGGHDYMDGTREAYEGAALMHARHGTTGLLPTSLAASMEELLDTLKIYEEVKDQRAGARFLGLHLEGPYLSHNQAGAQDPRYIRDPDPEEYKLILRECPHILRWTIAPERRGALEMGEYLREHGVTPSIGHSDATIYEVKEALRHGFNHITHLYSGCSTIVRKGGYRYPGIVESAYLYDDLTVEVIADGHHLPAELLQSVYKLIGPDRTTMVTDSLRGAGMPEGDSILGSLKNGQRCIIEGGVCKMPDRKAFAGSVATTDRLVRNMIQLAGVPLPVAVDMQTFTAAKIIGCSDKTGVLEKGRKADLILFDDQIHVSMTMVEGNIIYEE
ncbi:MAG: N-acetylglucosamine-6-phosphate deacetylase [Lachnospiraceae bacterium]|nr:N-acetylglucosamine-6-phosphate deacetylase [Lachnospiraceae bacterium]